MKLAVVGSRSFNDYHYLEATILSSFPLEDIDEIVSGGAQGADRMGEEFAKKYKIPTKIFLPDWSLGRGAGMIRNYKIINYADTVIAFWDGKSSGTRHSVELAKKSNKRLVVIRV